MTDPSSEKPDRRLGDLDARLRAARSKHEAKDKPRTAGRSMGGGLGFGMRLGIEIVSAVIVGGAIGLALDWWLGTKPWLALVFFILGFIAGITNVIRVVQGYGSSVGWRKPDKEDGGKAPGGERGSEDE